jgi:hypothetical protein
VSSCRTPKANTLQSLHRILHCHGWTDSSHSVEHQRQLALSSTIHLPVGDARLAMYYRATRSNSRCARRGQSQRGMKVGLCGATHSEGGSSPWFTTTPVVHPRIGQGVLGPSTDPQELVPAATQRFPRWSRGRRAHNLMNSNRLG